jgi:hypothetical protein
MENTLNADKQFVYPLSLPTRIMQHNYLVPTTSAVIFNGHQELGHRPVHQDSHGDLDFKYVDVMDLSVESTYVIFHPCIDIVSSTPLELQQPGGTWKLLRRVWLIQQ